MRVLFAVVACSVALTAGCSSDSGAAPTPTPAATSNLTVSDAVPTLDELRDLGLSENAAQCFIDTIDPDNTGKVKSAEAFMEAWAVCL